MPAAAPAQDHDEQGAPMCALCPFW